MRTAEAFAPAKINLTLHVTGRRADGYHLLDSLVVFADAGDRLWLESARRMELAVTGPFAAGVPADESNLVWKAAVAAGATCRIRLEKNLPHGAGLGGGSADAAAVLRVLSPPRDGASLGTALGASLGADVPVCLSAGPQRMQGVGEVLAPVPQVPVLDLVLVSPGVGISTPEVFAALENRQNGGMGALPRWADKSAFLHWLKEQRNDLEPPARRLKPQIGAVLGALADAVVARMSGSGTACFGVYDSAARARDAARRIARAHPLWWVKQVRTVAQASADNTDLS